MWYGFSEFSTTRFLASGKSEGKDGDNRAVKVKMACGIFVSPVSGLVCVLLISCLLFRYFVTLV